MRVQACEIPDVKLLLSPARADARGWLAEIWREEELHDAGILARFVQQNASRSTAAGTIRGLHFQAPPLAQGKLIKVLRGAIHDVAVDLREGSSFRYRHVAVRLVEGDGSQLWIPPGFAHGFCTLEPETEVLYALTERYAPELECGLAWDDPDLGIAWPLQGPPRLSAKDASNPRLRDL